MTSGYVKRMRRSFERAQKDRQKLRAQRRAMGLCPDCGAVEITDTGYCGDCTAARSHAPETTDLDAADIKAWGG